MFGPDVTTSLCEGIFIPSNVSQFIFLSSLALFIIWRLRQIENKTYDSVICGVLFFGRFSVHLVQVVLTVPTAEPSPDIPGTYLCEMHIVQTTTRALFYTYNGLDVVIDIYVTARLVYILNKANINAKYVAASLHSSPPKRTLFTAIIYWNFVRLFAAFLHYGVILSGVITYQDNPFKYWTFQLFALIVLSYSITADAEIVRVVGGRPVSSNKGGSNAGSTGKKTNSYQASLPSPRAPPTYKSHVVASNGNGDGSQLSYVQHGSTKELPVYEEVNGQTMALSIKRASFLDMATTSLGFRGNDSDGQYNTGKDRDLEKAEVNDTVEIVQDEEPVSVEEFDVDAATNRSSTFSGDTAINVAQSSVDSKSVILEL
ncbi:4273_t:CDS:2 [Paraglomus occultum]|uniref:4273_t:CDS:1 n=1 Tax=Paraglomus occultum TaxID=144539 RepID=A0A9N9AXL2_9GLOM|nr:4273_t:CDS:2 [Paraglomus occultum]